MTKFFMIAAMALTLATTAHAQSGAANGQQPQLTQTNSDQARHEAAATNTPAASAAERASMLSAARDWTQAALDCDCATSVLAGVSAQMNQSGH